jgi:hydroxymethylbilane synthase
VAAALTAATGVPVELVIIRTRGDEIVDRPLRDVGGKGLFTKEIEDALLSRAVDFAVHSLKDLPVDGPAGLVVHAIPERADPRDALIGAPLGDLPEGARVGTGSPRRRLQLAAIRPDLRFEELRGNVDTRVRRQREGDFDAVVLACAGLDRLGRGDDIAERLPPDVIVPAVGQGALALQCRAEDRVTCDLLSALHHGPTAIAVAAERAFLAAIGGSCHVPAACHAVVDGPHVVARAFFADDQGRVRTARRVADPLHVHALGNELARAVSG